MTRSLIYSLALCALWGCGEGTQTEPAELEYKCEVPETCEALRARRVVVESEWSTLLDEQKYDELSDPGNCSARLALSELDRCDLDPCSEICRLHPAPVLASESCAERCEQLKSELSVDLRGIVEAAAKTPGVPTCDICSQATFSFCAQMWGCMSS